MKPTLLLDVQTSVVAKTVRCPEVIVIAKFDISRPNIAIFSLELLHTLKFPLTALTCTFLNSLVLRTFL